MNHANQTPQGLSLSLGPGLCLTAALLMTLGSLPLHGYAESITIPIASQGAQQGHIDKPHHGADQASVRSHFGEPIKRKGPTGEPPIVRWDYSQFSVYFENNTVIHSVIKHNPQAENRQTK